MPGLSSLRRNKKSPIVYVVGCVSNVRGVLLDDLDSIHCYGLKEFSPEIPPDADVLEPPLAYIGEWLLSPVDWRDAVAVEDLDGCPWYCFGFSTWSDSLVSDESSSIRMPCLVSRIYHVQAELNYSFSSWNCYTINTRTLTYLCRFSQRTARPWIGVLRHEAKTRTSYAHWRSIETILKTRLRL